MEGRKEKGRKEGRGGKKGRKITMEQQHLRSRLRDLIDFVISEESSAKGDTGPHTTIYALIDGAGVGCDIFVRTQGKGMIDHSAHLSDSLANRSLRSMKASHRAMMKHNGDRQVITQPQGSKLVF